MQSRIHVESLLDRAQRLGVDQDDLLSKLAAPSVLLIRLAPQEFPFETHQVQERILCLQGVFSLDHYVGDEPLRSVRVPQGSLALIPPGVTHRFSADSEAVILTLYGDALSVPG